jgi:hypothetical protein
MGSLSDGYENVVLDAILGDGAAASMPDPVYIALFTVMPTDDSFGTECTGASYARVSLANNSTNWPNASGGQKSNGVAVTFPTLTESWGTIVGWAIMDHGSLQDVTSIIVYNELADPVTPGVGDIPEFAIGALVIEAD